MRVRERFERLAGTAASRPVLTLSAVLVFALAGGLLALGLRPSAGTDTFVSSSSPSFQATSADQRNFGSDAVVILIRESLPNLVETQELATVSELEACLAGQTLVANTGLRAFTLAPSAAAPYGGENSACGKLRHANAVKVVYGPGTFLNRAVAAVNQQVTGMLATSQQAVRSAGENAYQLAIGKGLTVKQARQAQSAAQTLENQRQVQTLEQLALNSGITSRPSIDNKAFISQIVFDATRGVNVPKARFSYLFPTANSALIQVRLKASLSDGQRAQVISLIRQAVRMPMFRLQFGGTYTVSGVPVVTNDLANQVTGSIAGLLLAALVAMAVTLVLVFRRRLRLLPLGIALASVGITFGLFALFGATLTIASIAVLPILIGLSVDYGIQFQARVQEAQRTEDGSPRSAGAAVVRAAGLGGPTIATAALATGTGFLVLQLSPVPMVRGFGLLLVVGIAVSLLCALTAGSAAIALEDRDGGALGASLRGASEILGAAVRGAGEILSGVGAAIRWRVWRRRPSGRPRPAGGFGLEQALGSVLRRPGRVLALGALLAVLGWIADTQTAVQSDITKLVPGNMPALHDLRTLERATGVSGEVDVTVRGADVASPATIGWMIDYESKLLTHFGYLEERGCAKATLCPALSLPDLFRQSSGASTCPNGLTQSCINTLLDAVPGYFSQAVITPDRHASTLAFGIRLMPLARQERVLDYMRSQLRPPPGITASLAGVPVLAAQANDALASSSHRLLTLIAGLIAVGLALLVVFRRARRALVPLIPIALATGWSALILFVIGIPLNPMSATLGALVIAISTEFSVLLSERFLQERALGHDLPAALARTYRSTGAAVLASGVTAIIGFGVLVFSNITMLRDFGFVTLVDLSVSLGGVLLVLPAVLALSEREELLEPARAAGRAVAVRAARLRRRPRIA
jgi:hydrophobe/amphiphile efflux-3 (HAE3) family protein